MKAPLSMKNLDLTHHNLCRLLSGQACPEFHRRADIALTSTLGPDDWHLLATTARREGVAPLIYHALNACPEFGRRKAGWPADVPPEVQADLRQAYYATTARNILIYRELSRVLTVLFPLPVIVLKGAALAVTIYPSIGLRPMGDVDILVPEDRLTEAVARLKTIGYTEWSAPDRTPGFNRLVGHHVGLDGGHEVPLHLELHWTLVAGEHDWRAPSLGWFWSQTEEWKMENGGWKREDGRGKREQGVQLPSSVFQLTPTAHLLYLCAHLMLQHGGAQARLLWFYDIHLMIQSQSDRIDWDELARRAHEFHWAPALHAALQGARDCFGTLLPRGFFGALVEADDSEALRLLRRKADPFQTRATRRWADAASLDWHGRLRLAMALVFPRPAFVRWRYKPRPAWLWPLCYPYRWLDTAREGLTTLCEIGKGRMERVSKGEKVSGGAGERR